MKRLLRGVIDFQDHKVHTDDLLSNFQKLLSAKVDWTIPSDAKVYNFVKEYFENNLELPSNNVLSDYFVKSDDLEVQERLRDIGSSEVYTRTHYTHVLNQIVDDQAKAKLIGLLKQTAEITAKGLIIDEGRSKKQLKGVKDAVAHFTSLVHDLIPSEYSSKTRGDVRQEGQNAWNEYITAKQNKGKVWGKFTGIEEIDTVCRGIKKGEMWVHAAFTGELKTVFAVNWAYNLVTRYRTNVFYSCFEMPFEQLRRIIVTRHSANLKFLSQGKQPLDYQKVRDGELAPEEEIFYKEVLEDWTTNEDYASFHLWCPERDVSVSDIRMEVELLHKKTEIGLIVIDHGGLVKPKRLHKEYTIEVNSVIRDSKKMALHFNNGEGIPVLMLFQINRDGKDAADKAEGRYKIRALSYANETEKSADTITTTYLNEAHRENGTSLCTCLKNRDNPLFKPFLLGVNFSCRRLYRLDPSTLSGADIGIEAQDAVLDAIC